MLGPRVTTPFLHHGGRDPLDFRLVYLADGSVNSVTPDGKIAVNEVQRGSIRFNARDRVHYEELVKGQSRAIITELK